MHQHGALRRRFGRTFGLPVYSIYTLLTWFQAGLLPRRFLPQLDDTRP
jgi:hypothetical protein